MGRYGDDMWTGDIVGVWVVVENVIVAGSSGD